MKTDEETERVFRASFGGPLRDQPGFVVDAGREESRV
jgi:hypothetical protein